MNPLGRCWLQINVLTSCLPLRRTLEIVGWLVELTLMSCYVCLFSVTRSYSLNANFHTPDPEPTGNNPIDIPAQTSIPDEDVEELVTDLDVQAEVVLAFKPS